MSMHVRPLEPIPDLTARMARTSFRKGTLAMMLRDALDGVWNDEAFKALYPRRGREAVAPWRLAMVGGAPSGGKPLGCANGGDGMWEAGLKVRAVAATG